MLSGLQAIGNLPGLVRRILVYTGSRRLLTQEGIEVWPLEVLHSRLQNGTLWP
jgi:hypothetical protein